MAGCCFCWGREDCFLDVEGVRCCCCSSGSEGGAEEEDIVWGGMVRVKEGSGGGCDG